VYATQAVLTTGLRIAAAYALNPALQIRRVSNTQPRLEPFVLGEVPLPLCGYSFTGGVVCQVPDVTLTGNLEYQWPVTANRAGFGRVDSSYIGASFSANDGELHPVRDLDHIPPGWYGAL
jgi:hypothetical protein